MPRQASPAQTYTKIKAIIIAIKGKIKVYIPAITMSKQTPMPENRAKQFLAAFKKFAALETQARSYEQLPNYRKPAKKYRGRRQKHSRKKHNPQRKDKQTTLAKICLSKKDRTGVPHGAEQVKHLTTCGTVNSKQTDTQNGWNGISNM